VRIPIRLPARNKFNARKATVDGFDFDSQAEARRYGELKLYERAGKIRCLVADKESLRYGLTVNGKSIGYYEADFCYVLVETGETVVEDCKSPITRTPVYKLKKKLMHALYGIDIKEVL
jgi:hypothetical protein